MKAARLYIAVAVLSALFCSTAYSAIHCSGEPVRPRLMALCAEAECNYPPKGLTLIALKKEKRLEVWGADDCGRPRLVKEYEIWAASGDTGPKLREGDYQVPEGVYTVTRLNPNSRYHLSMKIDYPNAFDRKMAKHDRRRQLGGDIFIHGNAKSKGCIAIGNAAIEELYGLVEDTGTSHVRVIIAPCDLRTGGALPVSGKLPKWTPTLYKKIAGEMAGYKRPVAPQKVLVSSNL